KAWPWVNWTRQSRSLALHWSKENSVFSKDMGVVKSLGDSYSMSADVSHFEAHDVVVMAYNHHIVIHAEKVLENGSVSDTFTHKTLLPEDMDPLSVSATLTPMGMLVVSVRRTQTVRESEQASKRECFSIRV
uniref:SHSP domain-containing protein n=1 Tax=Esox lucius TaxID=8010 RepID=A0A3P9A5W8_ESOLU